MAAFNYAKTRLRIERIQCPTSSWEIDLDLDLDWSRNTFYVFAYSVVCFGLGLVQWRP